MVTTPTKVAEDARTVSASWSAAYAHPGGQASGDGAVVVADLGDVSDAADVVADALVGARSGVDVVAAIDAVLESVKAKVPAAEDPHPIAATPPAATITADR